MKGVFYMWRHSIKNYFKQAIKKPAPLIVYLLLLALVIFSLVMSSSQDIMAAERNVTGYAAVLVGVFLLIAVLSILNGLKQGAALFSVADVNFLFTSPVDASKILLCGIAKQASIMLMASLFMIAQYPNMRNLAGLDGMALLGLMVAYAGVGIVLNILSAALYAMCASSPVRRRRAYICITTLFAAILICFAFAMMQAADIQQALIMVFGSNVWNFIPIIGWARGLAVAFAEYQFLHAAIYSLLLLVSGYLCTRLLQGSDMDFFEDVLLAAELADQKREDAKTGRMTARGGVSSRVKRDLGALGGKGAFVFAHRILRERSRGGLGLLDTSTLGAAAVPLICMVLLGTDSGINASLWPLFFMAAWILLFINLRSNIQRELTFPLLYLAPFSAFTKLLAILLPQFIKSLVDGAVFALLVTVLLKVSVLEGLITLLYYVSITMVFSAGSLIVERLLGSMRNRVVVKFLYMFMLLVLYIPGAIAAIILGASLPANLDYLLCVIWNSLMAFLVVFLCRNILTNMELA